jgi:hypothetical protein
MPFRILLDSLSLFFEKYLHFFEKYLHFFEKYLYSFAGERFSIQLFCRKVSRKDHCHQFFNKRYEYVHILPDSSFLLTFIIGFIDGRR